jgi:hypothetical protein
MPRRELGDLSFTPEEIRVMQADTHTGPPVENQPTSVPAETPMTEPAITRPRATPRAAAVRRWQPLAFGIASTVLVVALLLYVNHLGWRPALQTDQRNPGVMTVTESMSAVANARGRVNLRVEASLGGGVITSLRAGTPLRVLGYTRNGWVQVRTSAGSGFIWGGYVRESRALPFRPGRERGAAVVFYEGRVLRP